MNEDVQTFSWDENLYNSLVDVMKSGEYVGVNTQQLGTIIGVRKKHEKDQTPYIEVMFQVND